jgi:hypothetical protein
MLVSKPEFFFSIVNQNPNGRFDWNILLQCAYAWGFDCDDVHLELGNLFEVWLGLFLL